MSGDVNSAEEIHIPSVFLFHTEGERLLDELVRFPTMMVRLGERMANTKWLIENFFLGARWGAYARKHIRMANPHVALSLDKNKLRLNFHFDTLSRSNKAQEQQRMEANIKAISRSIYFRRQKDKQAFLNVCRKLAYSLLLGYGNNPIGTEDLLVLHELIQGLQVLSHTSLVDALLMRTVEEKGELSLNTVLSREHPAAEISQTIICDWGVEMPTCYQLKQPAHEPLSEITSFYF
jgi:hypothetical protein